MKLSKKQIWRDRELFRYKSIVEAQGDWSAQDVTDENDPERQICMQELLYRYSGYIVMIAGEEYYI